MLETEMGHQTVIGDGLVKMIITPLETITLIKEKGSFPSSMILSEYLINHILNKHQRDELSESLINNGGKN